jgi:hypothetical protein
MWTWIGGILAALAVGLTGLGLYYDTTAGYVSLLMFDAVLFWLASITSHLSFESSNITHSHA